MKGRKDAAAKLLDGRALAKRMMAQLAPRVAAVLEARGEAPLLAILSIGGSPESGMYLRSKLQACKDLGVETTVQAMHAGTSQAEASQVLDDLSRDPNVDGIILEVPLPPQLDIRRLLERVHADKDVEGITLANYGRLFAARTLKDAEESAAFLPCTPGAILALLRESGVDPKGKEAVVVGRSNIVGKPTAHLLTCLDATVTLCHSKTAALAEHLKRADIVVAACGRALAIKGKDLKRGCVVLDAGINPRGRTVVGDVDQASASEVASALSPVPGGVGPVTTAVLLQNTVLAAERRTRARLG